MERRNPTYTSGRMFGSTEIEQHHANTFSAPQPPMNNPDPWAWGDEAEFANRDEYLEILELAEQQYNYERPQFDGGAANDTGDDVPLPPPGLRRLVTGQTVSLDEVSLSPAFDRLVPGEGDRDDLFTESNSARTVPGQHSDEEQMRSERLVTGSVGHPNLQPQPTSSISSNSLHNQAYNSDISNEHRANSSETPWQRYASIESTNASANRPEFDPCESISYDIDDDFGAENTGYQNNYITDTAEYPRYSVLNTTDPSRSVSDQFNNSVVDFNQRINFQLHNPRMETEGLAEPENQNIVSAEEKMSFRMMVEGSSETLPVTKQNPVQNPSYDYWYSNSAPITDNQWDFDPTYNSSNREPPPLTERPATSGLAGDQPMARSDSPDQVPCDEEQDWDHSRDSNSRESNGTESISAAEPYDISQSSASKIEPFSDRLNQYEAQKFNIAHCAGQEGHSYTKEHTGHQQSVPEGNLYGSLKNVPKEVSREKYSSARREDAADNHENKKHAVRNSQMHDALKRIPIADDGEQLRADNHTYGGANTSESTHVKPPARKLSKQFSVNQSNVEGPPAELQRMVVGETCADVPLFLPISDESKSRHKQSVTESRPGLDYRIGRETRHEWNKKQKYRSRRMESDEELEDFDKRYESDKESIPYNERDECSYRSRKFGGRSQRQHRTSSFAPSQDDSYYEDDEDDYCNDTYRYVSRKPPRDTRYQREENYRYKDDRRYHRERNVNKRRDPYSSRMDNAVYYERESRPPSRSESEYRRHEYYDSHQYQPRQHGRQYERHHETSHQGYNNSLSLRDRYEKFFDIDHPPSMQDVLKFRATDPEGYAAWYAWFVRAKKKRSAENSNTSVNKAGVTNADVLTLTDRRGSGLASGQSSINEDVSIRSKDLVLDTIEQENDSCEDQQEEQSEVRYTPVKFSVPHVKAVFNSLGQLVVVNPKQPLDGETASVDIYQLLPSQHDKELTEFLNFPGPFFIGETHVNTVCEYLRNKANRSNSNSEKLLYLLVELIIKLRGIMDGISISELLLENYESTGGDLRHIMSCSNSNSEDKLLKVDDAEFLEKYTRLLLQGNKTTALELAISNKAWSHALSLAYKMDAKYFTNVLAMFDSSTSSNTPLSTLYQLLSDQVPQAAECCANEHWSDWRPHLAMILSNASSNPCLARNSVVTLGDSLATYDIFASHFCYLTIQSDLNSSNKHPLKHTLLSEPKSTHMKPATNTDAILLTQAYEFAVRLQKKDFSIPLLVPYKYLLAQRLASYGKYSVAFKYLQSASYSVLLNPPNYDRETVHHIVDLAERIKYRGCKPFPTHDLSPDESWLIQMHNLLGDVPMSAFNVTSHKVEPVPSECNSTVQPPEVLQQPAAQSHYTLHQPPEFSAQSHVQQDLSYQQQRKISEPSQNQYSILLPQNAHDLSQMRDAAAYTAYAGLSDTQEYPLEVTVTKPVEESDQMSLPAESSGDTSDQYNVWEPQPQQQISISTRSNYSYFDDADVKSVRKSGDDTAVGTSDPQPKKLDGKETDPKSNKKEKRQENAENSAGWLGGIFSKLALRPKNQMKLPDDKNPSIVWSEEKNRWVSLNGGDNDAGANLKPPPKASEMMGAGAVASGNGPLQRNAPNSLPLQQTSSLDQNDSKPLSMNMYKMPRGKGMQANYVNVLSQNTIPTSITPQSPSFGMLDGASVSQPHSLPPNINLFVPTPTDGSSSNPAYTSSGPYSQQVSPSTEGPVFYNPSRYRPV